MNSWKELFHKHTWFLTRSYALFLCMRICVLSLLEYIKSIATVIFCFSHLLCRSQLQGFVYILPYMAAIRHLGDNPPGRSKVTLLSVTSEANSDPLSVNYTLGIQSPKIHASWTHQGTPNGPWRDRNSWKKEKKKIVIKKVTQKVIKKMC